ncbi:MAG: fasciclin domain-containing protein, partial [Bacteroidota bacterium]
MNTRLHLLSVEFPAELLRKSLMLMAALMISVAAISQNTVVDVIVNSDDHNTLETAVLAAELDDDLSGDGPFTVFAPTDAAFEALPDGVLAGLLDDPTGALAKVLLYHVVGASVTSGDLTSGQFATTLNGDSIVVTIDGSDVYINNAMVTSADIAADNGIVHVIDAVITPGSTVYEVVAGSEDHTTLEAAVVAAGLQGTLSGPGPFTVFAPTDAAF